MKALVLCHNRTINENYKDHFLGSIFEKIQKEYFPGEPFEYHTVDVKDFNERQIQTDFNTLHVSHFPIDAWSDSFLQHPDRKNSYDIVFMPDCAGPWSKIYNAKSGFGDALDEIIAKTMLLVSDGGIMVLGDKIDEHHIEYIEKNYSNAKRKKLTYLPSGLPSPFIIFVNDPFILKFDEKIIKLCNKDKKPDVDISKLVAIDTQSTGGQSTEWGFFEQKEKLGSGGNGDVFLYRYKNYEIAMKIYNKQNNSEINLVEMLSGDKDVRNGIIPHKMLEMGEEKMLAMKLADGDLKSFAGNLSNIEIFNIMEVLVKYFLVLKESGYYYLDLKLSNILYKCMDKKNIKIYLGDIGSLCTITKTEGINITRTAAYDPPENMIEAKGKICTESSIVWKLMLILLSLSGDADNAIETIKNIIKEYELKENKNDTEKVYSKIEEGLEKYFERFAIPELDKKIGWLGRIKIQNFLSEMASSPNTRPNLLTLLKIIQFAKFLHSHAYPDKKEDEAEFNIIARSYLNQIDKSRQSHINSINHG